MATFYWTDHYGHRWTVCPCLQKWLPAYEAELLRRGLIFECIDLYQTIGNAAASAGTHSKGGCADLKQRTYQHLWVARQMGAAAWGRDADPNDGQPDFQPEHQHLSLKGCPHAVQYARDQVDDLEDGFNGLGVLEDHHGAPDDGPREGVHWPLRTWEQGIAWAKEQAVTYPADILGKHFQKVTLPVDGPDSGNYADEVTPPRLFTYSSRYLRVVPEDLSVLFIAYHGGATTSGSHNPRCEARETNTDGSLARWDGRRGHHRLRNLEYGVNRLTPVRPHDVLAQIHNATADVTTLRVEGIKDSAGKLTDRMKVWITRGNTSHGCYVGTIKRTQRFSFEFDVHDGNVHFLFNGKPVKDAAGNVFTVAATADCYFKLGNYLQSNPETAPHESTNSSSEIRLFTKPIVEHLAA